MPRAARGARVAAGVDVVPVQQHLPGAQFDSSPSAASQFLRAHPHATGRNPRTPDGRVEPHPVLRQVTVEEANEGGPGETVAVSGVFE